MAVDSFRIALSAAVIILSTGVSAHGQPLQSAQYVPTTIAGGGVPATPAEALSIPFAFPTAVATDASGNLYIAAMNCVFMEEKNGTVMRVAGRSGNPGYSGDGGPATSAQLNQPQSLATDPAGNVYIADSGNNTIRRVQPNGIITSLIVNGAGAYFGVATPLPNRALDYPLAVAADRTGNLYMGEYGKVLRLSPAGALTTIAGTGAIGDSGDGGPATSAEINTPRGIAVDASGNVYVSDAWGNAVHKIATNGTISTFVSGGLNYPAGIALDSTGALYIADNANSSVRQVAPNGTISTVAGNGQFLYGGDGGPAISAELSAPYGVAVDTAGDLYIADWGNNRIRVVSAGVINTYAGNGTAFWGDGSLATDALMSSPTGVAADDVGNIYISDTRDNRVRRINAEGVIYTFAGNGVAAYKGDGGPATEASLYWPAGIALDTSGNLLIADWLNSLIRRVTPGGIITTAAGNGQLGFAPDHVPATSVPLMSPQGVATDAAGNFYIADTVNSAIRKVTKDGVISRIAGTGAHGYDGDGGAAVKAELYYPQDIAVNGAGDVYVADTGNQRVRLVGAGGTISTIAGNGLCCATGDGGPAKSANLIPNSAAIDPAGNLFTTDQMNTSIREISPSGTIVTVASGFQMPNGVALDAAGDLLVSDDLAGTLTMFVPAGSRAVLSASLTHAGDFIAGQSDATWSVVVSNAPAAAATNGAVTVTEIAPAGVTINGMSGNGWSCASGTCSRSDSLAAGGGYPPITITAEVGSAAQTINAVSVTGGGAPATGTTDLATVRNSLGNQDPINAGSRLESVAPGSIAVVYGSFPVPAAGLSLQLGGIAAPVLYASGSEAIVQVPWELAGKAQADLTTGSVAPFAPGIFTADGSGGGQGVIVDAGRLADASNPANPGDTVQIFCTGLGAVTSQPPTGSPAPANALVIATPVVTINGLRAQLSFAGLVAGTVGQYAVNAQVPGSGSAQPAAREVPVMISIGGAVSNVATMWVRQ